MSFYHWFPSHPNESELSGDSKKLNDIGQELRITSAKQEQRPVQTDFQRISSVPDVWSQHRLFDMLLLNKALDPSYVEYEHIAQREWRAMLALVVLAESYGVSLQTRTIVFGDEQKKSPFLEAAYSMRPNRESWTSMDIYYIEKDGREYPIAMTSPTVHLVPAKDAWQSLRKAYEGRIPFLTKDMVHAPVVESKNGFLPFMLGEEREERTFGMLPIHALMLKEWISMYRKQAPETQNMDILVEYEKALTAAYGLNIDNMPSVGSFFAAETQRMGTKLFGVRVPNKMQMFLDRVFYALIEQNSTVDMIPDTHKYAGGISAQCIFSQQKANGEYAHFFVAMPVTETFWQLWQANESCKPTYTIDCEFNARSVNLTKIKVTVKLGAIEFSKTYAAGEIDNNYWRNLCTAGIWPRQKITDWSEYFLFCYEINDYRIEPLKKGTAHKVKSYENKEGIEGALHYYKLNESPDCCLLLKNRAPIGYLMVRDRQEIMSGDDENVYRASIDFGTSSTTLYGGIEKSEPKKISGMNLWSLPLINTIDSQGNESSWLERYFFPPLPSPMERAVQGHIKDKLKGVSFEEIQKDSNLAAFYPSCIPMQTILADAMTTNESRGYLRDSWIYFRNFAAKRKVETWPKICSNLKWAHADPADMHRIRAILAEILVMIALEARSRRCGKISIIASYPLSFEDKTKESYYEALDAMLRAVCTTTGLLVQLPKTDDNTTGKIQAQQSLMIDDITESEAVFRFAVRQNTRRENYFVIDVGGGSTDVFISLTDQKQERNLYSTSLGFGARKVLLDKLKFDENRMLRLLVDRADDSILKVIENKQDYLEKIAGHNADSLIEDLFALRVPFDADHPAAMLVPENFGEAFLKYCAGTKGDVLFMQLKKRIAFYLGATAWLSGMMLRQEKNPKLSVMILFAGNGSKMLRWLDSELDRTKYFVYQIFQKSVGVEIDRKAFDCLFSTMQKEEVAYGALIDLPTGFYDVEKTEATQVFFDRENAQTSSIPSYHSLRYGRKDISTDREEFVEFMKTFRESAMVSYEWPFDEDEYDVSILERNNLGSAIATLEKNAGFFLSAVDVISNYYLGETTKVQAQ